jgi:outer membrane protein TolC
MHHPRNFITGLVQISFGLLLTFARANAQDTSYLALKEAIDSALANNHDLHLAIMDEKIAASKWKETGAIFLPQVDLSVSGMNTNNPLNAFGFKLQQQSVTAADFNPAILNHPGGTSDFTTRLQLRQPILNLDQVYMRKAAATQKDLYQLRAQRTKEWLAFEVQRAYMQLQLAYDAVAVMSEALETANATFKFTSQRVAEGLLQQSDELNVKVRVKTVETDLAEAKSNVQDASDYLGLLMGRSPGMIYQVERNSTIKIQAGNETNVPVNRADFVAMRKAIEATRLSIESSRKTFLPRLNAFAQYQFNDNRLAGFGANTYLAGVQLSWDLFKGAATKNRIATQTLEKNKLGEQLDNQQHQGQVELNKTRRQLSDAMYMIDQQTVAVESAREALRILQDRYEQGLVNSTDLLAAQSQLSQQRLGLAQAYFNYNTAAAYLAFLTSSAR